MLTNDVLRQIAIGITSFPMTVGHDMEMAQDLLSARARIAELEEKIEMANSQIDDYRASFKVVLDDKCPTDEIHCGCVPILKQTVFNYRNSMALITTFPEMSGSIGSIIKIAESSLKENYFNDYGVSKSIGEYWVNKLEEMEYKLSQKISELEAENREWRSDAERLAKQTLEFCLEYGHEDINDDEGNGVIAQHASLVEKYGKERK